MARSALRGSQNPAHASVLAAACALALSAGAPALAQSGSPITTNEAFVEQVTRNQGFEITDKKAVFAFVFKHLPERVKVYPTEHYYYFKFSHQGQTYNGNFRLENDQRDQGKMHFAYTSDFTDWLPPGDTQHILLEKKDGITIDKTDEFTYRVTFEGKSTTFELNRMEGVKPPPQIIAADEKYLGPIFDESAVRFFLVYNSKLKQFLYILDETGPPSDILLTAQASDRILLGQRTGFAFYRDHKLDRRILIGVYEGNSRVNNYYDGPFDQLPDNFIEGDALKDAILEVDPSLKGKIDRFGSSFDGETRYMIAPYMHYNQESDLTVFHRCAVNKRVPAALYYACFVLEETQEGQTPRVAGETKAGLTKTPPQKKKKGQR